MSYAVLDTVVTLYLKISGFAICRSTLACVSWYCRMLVARDGTLLSNTKLLLQDGSSWPRRARFVLNGMHVDHAAFFTLPFSALERSPSLLNALLLLKLSETQ